MSGAPDVKWYRIAFNQRGSYEHRFGHDPNLLGLAPSEGSVPFHLVLTLDLNDPKLAHLRSERCTKLRLAHPFRYEGIGSVTYRQSGSDSLTLATDMAYVSNPDDWPYEDYPLHFPAMPCDLVELPSQPKEPRADVAFMAVGEPSFEMAISGTELALPSIQAQEPLMPCPACRKGKSHYLATIPSQPFAGIDLWGEGGEYVWILFFHCADCNSVTTFNETD